MWAIATNEQRAVMEVNKRTPHEIFNMPQRFSAPLFQRPYVWTEKAQWEPLWGDITRVAERQLSNTTASAQSHFIGAVVLQQIPNAAGDLQERLIIDGQQRLTTLQILLDAMHAVFEQAGLSKAAKRLEPLIRNDDAFCRVDEDQYKVWPTNRDRPAFCEVMSAATPVDYANLTYKSDRLVEAHQYFATQVNEWIGNGSPADQDTRAGALDTTARRLLQIVVIELGANEDAQEIFETLNARGAQLSAADLIKNFIFQRLLNAGDDTERAYEEYWKQFESGFWEREVTLGRFKYPRAAVFLSHFLVARTGEYILTQEVFARFKKYAIDESHLGMLELLRQIHLAAVAYEKFSIAANNLEGVLAPLEMFSYRTSILDSETIKPVVLFLIDPNLEQIQQPQLDLALSSLESYLMRRFLVSATGVNYTHIFARLLVELNNGARDEAGLIITKFLASQTANASYWPDDAHVVSTLKTFPIFRKGRRLRMVMEAVEDHKRGFQVSVSNAAGEQPVKRGTLTLEHILPRKWEGNWPLEPGQSSEERKEDINVLGNLTLLTTKLNSANSNRAWLGDDNKREKIAAQSILLLNSEITNTFEPWTSERIAARTESLTEAVLNIWPTPPGHSVDIKDTASEGAKPVSVSDLLNVGLLNVGDVLHPFSKAQQKLGRTATVLADGRLETDDGEVFKAPSAAGAHAFKMVTCAGWKRWGLGTAADAPSLGDLRAKYREQFSIDDDDSEGASDDDDLDEITDPLEEISIPS